MGGTEGGIPHSVPPTQLVFRTKMALLKMLQNLLNSIKGRLDLGAVEKGAVGRGGSIFVCDGRCLLQMITGRAGFGSWWSQEEAEE